MRKETVYFLNLGEVNVLKQWHLSCMEANECCECSQIQRDDCMKTFSYVEDIGKELTGR